MITAVGRKETLGERLRQGMISALYAIALRAPKILQIRRNENSWTIFRILLGCIGAGLVILPLSLWNSWTAAIVGLALFLTAALLPPAQTETESDEAAKQLQALVVVNGGEYQPGNALATEAELFVGAERIWALDGDKKPMLVIPVGEISYACAVPAGRNWLFEMRWADRTAEFYYRGMFAEHLARIAETTVQSVVTAHARAVTTTGSAMAPTTQVLPAAAAKTEARPRSRAASA